MRQLANNKRQINTPADLEGLKLRAVPSELILTTLKALGANPTPMAYGEVYSALQTNVIDGEEVNIRITSYNVCYTKLLRFCRMDGRR